MREKILYRKWLQIIDNVENSDEPIFDDFIDAVKSFKTLKYYHHTNIVLMIGESVKIIDNANKVTDYEERIKFEKKDENIFGISVILVSKDKVKNTLVLHSLKVDMETGEGEFDTCDYEKKVKYSFKYKNQKATKIKLIKNENKNLSR